MKTGNVGAQFSHLLSVAPAEWEFQCFAKLGPLTREVLNYALVPISAADVWGYWAQRGGNTDKAMASDLRRRIRQLTGIPYEKCIVENIGKEHVGKPVRSEGVVETAEGTALPVVAGNGIQHA